MKGLVGPAVLAMFLHAELVGYYVWHGGGNPAVLTCVGSDRAGAYPYEAVRDPRIQRGFGPGYDGQFYYAIARAPLARHCVGLDLPAVRHVRIAYPALCWLFSGGGDPERLFWVMPLVNLVAVGVLAGFGAAAAGRRGLTPWWGVMLPLAVNTIGMMLRDLTDVVAILAVCGMLCAWLWGWPAWSLGLWAAAALFAREQAVLVVLGLAAIAVRQHKGSVAAALGTALAAFACWVGVLRLTYAAWPVLPTEGNLAPTWGGIPLPFHGLWQRWTHLHLDTAGLTHLLGALIVSSQLVLVGFLLFRRADPALLVTGAAGALLAVIGGDCIYLDYWSYPRVFAWMPLALWLAAAEEGRGWMMGALALPVTLQLYLFCKFL